MFVLVTGGSASGKSEYAEGLTCSLAGPGVSPTYLATMEPHGAEGGERIRRHKARRENKGFITVECPRDLPLVYERCGPVMLLECLSNLTANEMFRGNGVVPDAADTVLSEVVGLMERTDHLIVVTNEIFSDGGSYPAETLAYLSTLGELNRRLAARADRVVEVVCGIPLMRKGT